GVAEGCLRLAEAGVGDTQRHVGRVGEAALLDVLRGDRADGDRSLLQVLLPVARRDDDLLEAAGSRRVGRLVLRRLVLRERARCTQRKRSDAERRASRGWLAHTYPLLKSLHGSKTAGAACARNPRQRSRRDHQEVITNLITSVSASVAGN